MTSQTIYNSKGEPIGRITGESTPSYFTLTVNPRNIPPLYEYVYVELYEIPPGEEAPIKVNVLAQIREIKRRDIGLNPNLPWKVVEEIGDGQTEDQILATARVLGYKWKNRIYTPRHAPPANTWVYRAPDNMVKDFYSVPEDKGLHVGYLISRPNVPVYLDVRGINRHVAIIAATGSGKTWTSIVLIEELLKKGATILVLDPHGEYVKIKDSINRLGEEYSNSVIVLKGHKDQDGDILYKISIKSMSYEELAAVAGIPPNASRIRAVLHGVKSLAAILADAFDKPRLLSLKSLRTIIEASITAMEHKPSFKTFYTRLAHELKLRLDLDISNLEKDPGYAERMVRAIRRIWLGLKRDPDIGFDLIRYLGNLARIGVYGSKIIPLKKILRPAHITIFNLSGLRKEVQDHLVYNILTRVFKARINYKRGLKGETYPDPVVIVVEEAHRFAPPKTQEDTWSREILSKIAAEGRKFGVFLIVITQRPSKIDADLLSQCQSQIISRIINPRDQDAVRDASEQLSQDLLNNLPGLNPGEVIVVGPLAPAPLMIRVRDRVLDYAGADIDVISEWSKHLALTKIKTELLLVARKLVRETLGVDAVSPKDIAEGLAKIISLTAIVDQEVLDEAINKLAILHDNIEVRYDRDLGLISGVIDNEKVEIKLADGSWRCSCGREQPCWHTIALLLESVNRRVVSINDLRKFVSLRVLNTMI